MRGRRRRARARRRCSSARRRDVEHLERHDDRLARELERQRGFRRRGAVGVERRPERRRLDRLGLALRAVGEGDRARRRAAELDREHVAARRRDDA
jgi:hypothetical protein